MMEVVRITRNILMNNLQWGWQTMHKNLTINDLTLSVKTIITKYVF